MEKFRVKIEQLAENDIVKHFKSGNKATIKKINVILRELANNPFEGTGHPEQLKYEF
jgi:toxin YoeB